MSIVGPKLTPPGKAAVIALVAQLPGPVEIDSVSLGSPSATDLSEALPNSDPNGIFVTVTSNASQGLSSQRAEWQAQIVISALWSTFTSQNLGAISGGRLVDSNASFSDVQSAETWFTDLENSGRYLNAKGMPAKLTLGESIVRSSVQAEASLSGAVVSNVAFGKSLGDVVEVDLTVADPLKWIESLGDNTPWGTLDIRNLDGAMLVVRDGQGNLVKSTTFSSGYQSGSAIYGPTYDHPPYLVNAGSATTPATAASSTSH